ncbi:Protein EXORDIUM [Bienertia sinuspersici]
MTFHYHKGPLLNGNITVNLIWYGNFKPTQRAIISDFITSFHPPPNMKPNHQLSHGGILLASITNSPIPRNPPPPTTTSTSSTLSLSLAKQVFHETYPLGKSLTNKTFCNLASKGGKQVNIVLTASDVTVDGFCRSRCGTHGSSYISKTTPQKFTYIWVGNSETQCPGQCAWPFEQPIYGPQSPPLIAPNNDVGLDGMIINWHLCWLDSDKPIWKWILPRPKRSSA